MKIHSSIGLLLFSSIIGVLASNDSNSTQEDLYVLDDDRKPVKLDLSISDDASNITEDNLQDYVSFNLYTRSSKNVSEQLYVDDTHNLTKSNFDPTKETKFVTHGWMSSCNKEVCTAIRDAYLQNGDYNVIQIDWNEISKLSYVSASNYVVPIAKYVSRMIDFLESQGLDASDITVVGHSLGAHIAGLASYYAKKKVFYAVALDPAGPLFRLVGQGKRVSKGDADYVEVIHTTKLLGLNTDLGDSDFYPNDSKQPGCNLDVGESCSHSRAHELFAESINDNGFLSRQCSNFISYLIGACNDNPTAYMGGATPDLSVQGRYYLTTNSEPPYSKN